MPVGTSPPFIASEDIMASFMAWTFNSVEYSQDILNDQHKIIWRHCESYNKDFQW